MIFRSWPVFLLGREMSTGTEAASVEQRLRDVFAQFEPDGALMPCLMSCAKCVIFLEVTVLPSGSGCLNIDELSNVLKVIFQCFACVTLTAIHCEDGIVRKTNTATHTRDIMLCY